MSGYRHKHTPPRHVEGIPVEHVEDTLELDEECWVTLVPEDPEDRRLWEFDVDSGRLLRTR